ncbi:MAG TPA: hypothetical protein VF950_10625 [Planctomycetota bacterium]
MAAPAAPRTAPLAPPGPGRMALVVAIILAGVAVGGALSLRKPPAPSAPRPSIERRYEQVDLGTFRKELLVDAAALVHEPFEVKVALVLNPEYGDLAVYRPLVEKRRDLLRHIVQTEIVNAKGDGDLRKPTVLETLTLEIRKRLNDELGKSTAGQDMIQKVIFPESKLPLRR